MLKGDHLKQTITDMIEELVENAVRENIDPNAFPEEWNLGPLLDYIYSVFGFLPSFPKEEMADLTQEILTKKITQEVLDEYEKREQEVEAQPFLFLQKTYSRRSALLPWRTEK